MHIASTGICIRELETEPAAFMRPRMDDNILGENVARLRKHLGLNQEEFADRVGSAQANVSKWEKQGITPNAAALTEVAALAGWPPARFLKERWEPRTPPVERVAPTDDVATVGIQYIDLAFGLGATYTDLPVEIEVLHFPKVWIDSITHSPPALLTWTRGRGDSMQGTINDGDLVLLDRSKRKVDEQDAIWAFTIGDVAALKRLRVKGDRFIIMSDNELVKDDEEPIDFVNIVGRVIFVGKRK